MVHMTQCGLHQRLWRRLAVLLLQVLLQRTGVDTDTDRDALVTRSVNHCPNAILAADVAGLMRRQSTPSSATRRAIW